MTSTIDGQPSPDPASVSPATTEAQARAADPAASAWVGANAGTGKTHVLAQRVLRLLLAGTPPERLLCLTFTKAAASEMANRVFERLGGWAMTSDGALETTLTDLLGRPPTADERSRARALFAEAIETPGGLKIQTIHAFCERLLQRFPLEACVAPDFTVLDDETRAELLRRSIDAVLTEASGEAEGRLGAALASIVTHIQDEGFDGLLGAMLAERETLRALIEQSGDETGNGAGDGAEDREADRPGDPFGPIEAALRRALSVRESATEAGIEAEMAGLLAPDDMLAITEALWQGKKTDGDAADRLAPALGREAGNAARIAAFADFFLTAKSQIRKRLMTKAVAEAHPRLLALCQEAQPRVYALHCELLGLRLVSASVALLRLSDRILDHFTRAKARRAALDYDDLIAHTRALLSSRAQAEWVLYKLDEGLDHILVDEAQDTSPTQWRIIAALAEEFFTGSGARDVERTLFAVGDEKQSIYGFQGAAPRMFAEMGAYFAERAASVGHPLGRVALDLSFRTVAPVLEAVDRVMSRPGPLPGLTAEGGAPPRHIAHRAGHAGLVELWETEAFEEEREEEREERGGEENEGVGRIGAWQPLAARRQAPPAQRLAARLADTIAGWLESGEMLASAGRPVRPGDILILVRKRTPFAAPMIRALKERGIAVAGADRLRITEQIGVMDLMVLGDFLTQPEDDLALATLLESPLLGLGDDDLFAIAHGREGALWHALREHAGADGEGRLAEAVGLLERLRARADYVPPFEFYAELLDRLGARTRLLARLGPEAGDTIDVFLDLALAYDEAAAPSLRGFLDWLRSGAPEIKRDMEQGRDEVRVMTVHGAKGLEAPIVFLPDTCRVAGHRGRGRSLVHLTDGARPPGAPPLPVWALKGAGAHPAIKTAIAAAEEAEREEYHRLLYVAMTRARDRLYVCGFEGRRPARDKGCWYDLIAERLDGWLEEGRDRQGRRIRRRESLQSAPTRDMGLGEPPPAPRSLPDWARRPAPRERTRTVPLAPSSLVPLIAEDSERRHALPSPSPSHLAGEHRFLRGTLTHALLEHLPRLAPDGWRAAAERFVAERGAALGPHMRANIVTETLAILAEPDFAPLFAVGSEAEVPIAAEIAPPNGAGPPLRISGQIDRLAIGTEEILILDYKTNRPPPETPNLVPEAYLLQLAAYRLVIRRIYARRRVRAALLWTDGPRLMGLSEPLLDEAEAALWRLDRRRGLDAKRAPS